MDDDEGLGKPSAKFEFDDETARKNFLDELQKIAWEYNVKMTTGGTGGKPKIKSLDKSIFDDAPPPQEAKPYVAPANSLLIFVQDAFDQIDDNVLLHIPVYKYKFEKGKQLKEFTFYPFSVSKNEVKLIADDGPVGQKYVYVITNGDYLRLNDTIKPKGYYIRAFPHPKYYENLVKFAPKPKFVAPEKSDEEERYENLAYLVKINGDTAEMRARTAAEKREKKEAAERLPRLMRELDQTPHPKIKDTDVSKLLEKLETHKSVARQSDIGQHMVLILQKSIAALEARLKELQAPTAEPQPTRAPEQGSDILPTPEGFIALPIFDEAKRPYDGTTPTRFPKIFAIVKDGLGVYRYLTYQNFFDINKYKKKILGDVNIRYDNDVVANTVVAIEAQILDKFASYIEDYPTSNDELVLYNPPPQYVENRIEKAYERLLKKIYTVGNAANERGRKAKDREAFRAELTQLLAKLSVTKHPPIHETDPAVISSDIQAIKARLSKQKFAPYQVAIMEKQIDALEKRLNELQNLEGLGKPWARFDFKNNDEMRRFTEKIVHIRWGDSGPRLDFKPAPAPEPTASMFPTDEGARTSDVWLLPVSGIKTDTKRFQNRKTEFSEASVERIVNDFDENKLDPIVVWRDPTNANIYVLSGHSRFEAHKRLGRDKIKARFFDGTESEAIRFAKVDANRAATSESLVEDIEAFRLDRDGSAHVSPLKKTELKAKWKDKANKLEAYSHLSPLGQFIKTLSQPDLSAWPGIVNKAMWAGELRAMYPHLTDAHEDELFNYMFKTGGSVEKMLKMTKEDLFAKVNDRANSIRYDPDEPLALTKVSTGYEARADTGPALARLKEIRKRIEQIDLLSKQTESKTARAELANEKATLQREAEFIDKDIDFLKSAQNALFGIGEIMNRWETLGYLSVSE